MLNKDPQLSFLDMAWSRTKMAEFFNREILPTVCPGREVTTLSVEDMSYIAGTKCEIFYSLQFGESSGTDPLWAVVAFAKDDRLEEVYTRHYRAKSSASGGPRPGPAVYLPEYRCLVELFPSDYALPFIAVAMDARKMAQLFPQVWTHAARERSGWPPRVEVLAYRPRRTCVLRYVSGPSNGDGSDDVIGKVYPEASKAARAWQALNAVYAQARGRIVIPKPLALVKDWNLIFMECVPGRSMKQALEEWPTGWDKPKEATRLAARALATVHSFRYGEDQSVRCLQTQLDWTRHRVLGVDLVAPQLAEQVEAMLAQIMQLGRQFSLDTPCFLHGDYTPAQLLLQDGRVAVVDFDRAWCGDAALDVGHFMAALHKKSLKGQGYFRELASEFLAEYQACLPQDGFMERARLFQATALVRMAVGSFRDAPRAYGRLRPDSRVDLLLREAASCLATL